MTPPLTKEEREGLRARAKAEQITGASDVRRRADELLHLLADLERAESEIERLKIAFRLPTGHPHLPGTCFVAFEDQQVRMIQAEARVEEVEHELAQQKQQMTRLYDEINRRERAEAMLARVVEIVGPSHDPLMLKILAAAKRER